MPGTRNLAKYPGLVRSWRKTYDLIHLTKSAKSKYLPLYHQVLIISSH